jgi:hypothetical protein
MTNYHLITTFVVLLIGAEVADKAQSGARHLLDEGATPSREGQLAHQRSKGLRRDVRVVGVRGVQSHLRAEMAHPTEQDVSAALRDGLSRPQDLEAGMIHSFSLSVSFLY